jgi:hypothetical protein
MLIVLGIFIYLLAVIISAGSMKHIHATPITKIVLCLFSIPILPAALTCDWDNHTIFWRIMCAGLLYVIAIILFFI